MVFLRAACSADAVYANMDVHVSVRTHEAGFRASSGLHASHMISVEVKLRSSLDLAFLLTQFGSAPLPWMFVLSKLGQGCRYGMHTCCCITRPADVERSHSTVR